MAEITSELKEPTEGPLATFQGQGARTGDPIGEVINAESLFQGETALQTGDPIPADLGAADSIQSQLSTVTEETQEQLGDVQGQIGEAEDEQAALKRRAEQFFDERESLADLTEEQFNRFGVIDDLALNRQQVAKIGELNAEIAGIRLRRDQALDLIAGDQVEISLINRRQATQEKRFNSRINALAAQAGAIEMEVQARNGNIAQARGIAGDIISAKLADQQAELQEIDFFRQINEAAIARLDIKEQNLIAQVRDDKLREIDVQREQLKQITDAMIANPGAGIKIDDDLETAITKASKFNETQEEKSFIRSLSLQYITAGITDDDTVDQAFAKAKAKATEFEKIELAGLQLGLEVQRAQIEASRASSAASRATAARAAAVITGPTSPSLNGVPDADGNLVLPDGTVLDRQAQLDIWRGLVSESGSASERSQLNGAANTYTEGGKILKLIASGVNTGPFAGLFKGGIFGIGARTFGLTSPDADALNAAMVQFNAQFIKAISGAQVAKAEFDRLQGLLPNERKTEQNNIAGINQILDFLSNKVEVETGVRVSNLPAVFPRTGAQSGTVLADGQSQLVIGTEVTRDGVTFRLVSPDNWQPVN